ncbi:2-acylglycerol O-acyltransferase 2-A-like [Chironomus tepperi]|uniref:2-acylglycerol O-acyltransferase 2-A-like n=1 Tax=Chironomus tepperi TaxID=113505 RepID=UPI00391F1596
MLLIIQQYFKSISLSIKWRPLNTLAIDRYMELFGALLFGYIVFFIEITCAYLVYRMIFYGGPITHLFLAGYIIFMIIDRKADRDCSRGQGSDWIRNMKIFKYTANYYPVKLIKTVNLSVDKNYLFAVFPHGVIGCGYYCSFVTNGTNFHQLFPGIRSRQVSLSYHFFIPFFRELVLAWGAMSANYEGIKNALGQSTDENFKLNVKDGYRSNAVVLSVGGAQEAMKSKPGEYRIYLKKRKGFIKAVLETGASLVPVFSFGEVDVYDQIDGPKLRIFQTFMKRLTTIAPIIFVGRSFLPIGGIPYRKPINIIVGAPIEVTKNPNPSQSDIDNLHDRYMVELEKLFEEHKWKYLKNAKDVNLIIE